MSNESVRKRRRGPELEAALLQAAWDELVAVGYAQLTYQAVAARAGTSRAVLYRRWPTRRELVLAALRRQAPPLAAEPPDTGELRGDVLALLRLVVERMGQLSPILRVLADEYSHDTELAEYLRTRNRGAGYEWMRTILDRAARRGEIDPAVPLPDRVVTLPVVLVLNEILLARGAPSKTDIEEVVDMVFLPLVLHHQQRQPQPLSGRS